MAIPIFTVDAFAEKRFAGNPAAVCILSAPRDEEWMKHVAREMNLSETAFVLKHGDQFDIRWFTPAVEVALCGHATLASAHILWEHGFAQAGSEIVFSSKSGPLRAIRLDEWIELDFPALPEKPVSAPREIMEALDITPAYVGRSRDDFLVLTESESIVRSLKPDHARLRTLDVRGIIVTAPSDRPRFDFVSRFFAPGAGIDEDPVTGSAHCCLGPFWQSRLAKSEFMAYQASARGGIVRVRVEGERVFLGGKAVTILKGELVE